MIKLKNILSEIQDETLKYLKEGEDSYEKWITRVKILRDKRKERLKKYGIN